MRTLSAVLLAALLLAPAVASAGGYAIPDENARSLALSQSDVADQTGPEAIYQNSAALAGQTGFAISGSFEMLYNRTTWSDPTLGSASLVPKANFPPALFAAYGNKLPNGMPFGLGVGFLVPGGGSIYWPGNWPGAQRIEGVAQKVFLLQAGVAIQPIDMVKLGATLLYYRAQEKLTQQINFIDHPGDATLGLAGGAVSFGLAGEFHAPKDTIPLTIGIDYRHKGDLTLKGDAHFDNVPPQFATILQDQAVTEHVTVPNELFIGAAYELIPNLKVMGSWNLERWIVYPNDTFVGDKGFTVAVPRDYKNAWVYRLGAEYANVPFLPPLTLRAGFLRSISPQPTNTVSPSLTDGDSTAFSVGAGFEFIKGLRLDVAYQFAFFDTVTATGPEAFPGSYKTYANLVSAGITWRPDF